MPLLPWPFLNSLQLVRRIKLFQHVLLTWLWYPFLMAAVFSCTLIHQSNKRYLFPREFLWSILQLHHFWTLSSTLYGTNKWKNPSWLWSTGLFFSQRNECTIALSIKKKERTKEPLIITVYLIVSSIHSFSFFPFFSWMFTFISLKLYFHRNYCSTLIFFNRDIFLTSFSFLLVM